MGALWGWQFASLAFGLGFGNTLIAYHFKLFAIYMEHN